MQKTVFSDEWDLVSADEIALSLPLSVETVPMENGSVAVLTQIVDGLEQYGRVKAGLEKPRKVQVIYPAAMLRDIGQRFLASAEMATDMAEAAKPKN